LVEDISQIINLVIAIAGLSGVGGLFWGIYQYRENRIMKRKDILFQLVHEFDRSKEMDPAKKILDGYVYNFPESMNLGINYFTKDNLKQILRYHHDEPEIVDSNEIKIRESFSTLFDFFDKLGYLFSNGVVKERELSYFSYYINSARESDGVLQFVKNYHFRWNGELPQLK
jgi:hypothetical protein